MSTQISGQITQVYTKIKDNIGKVIVGKSETVDMLLVSLLCGGHVLLEDVPGTGKTVLIKSLAASVSCQYKRIQFTPDLLPSDITGVNFFNVKKSEFEFVPGPIFANIVLADGNKPRDTQNAVRTFGMHGGDTGDHRRKNL